MLQAMIREGVLGRGLERGIMHVGVHDLRDFSGDRHRTVDDVTYGGGPGMVLKAEPFFGAVSAIKRKHGSPKAVVLLSPQGRRFSHQEALRLSRLSHITLLCGRYEGVDERVRGLATDELSIGDYVLSGGEIPAAVVIDAVARLLPGVVGDERSVAQDSFARGLLDHPHFTRPAQVESQGVPEVLMSGHHDEIRRWRKREALKRTLERRPDLLDGVVLDDEERDILRGLQQESKQ